MIELFDLNYEKILTIFSISPGSRWNRKTIKDKTRIPNIILDKYLSKLINLKILNKINNLYELNLGNSFIKEISDALYKEYSKYKHLPLSEYFTIKEIVNRLIEIKDISGLYLFGSYAKLIFKKESDIDIAIISNSPEKKKINDLVSSLEKKYNKSIDIHFFSKDFYKNKRDALVKEVLQHGIKII